MPQGSDRTEKKRVFWHSRHAQYYIHIHTPSLCVYSRRRCCCCGTKFVVSDRCAHRRDPITTETGTTSACVCVCVYTRKSRFLVARKGEEKRNEK